MNVSETEEEREGTAWIIQRNPGCLGVQRNHYKQMQKPDIAKLRNWPALRAISFLTNYYPKFRLGSVISQGLLCWSWVQHAYLTSPSLKLLGLMQCVNPAKVPLNNGLVSHFACVFFNYGLQSKHNCQLHNPAQIGHNSLNNIPCLATEILTPIVVVSRALSIYYASLFHIFLLLY